MEKELQNYYATGKRKTAQARVWLTRDTKNEIIVNSLTLKNYFKEEVALLIVNQPFVLTNTKNQFSVKADVSGGGKAAQSEALRHGISKALLLVDSTLRPVLKKNGLLTRDSREKERMKYGQKGARARYQFSKR